jgi:hypothetical protein
VGCVAIVDADENDVSRGSSLYTAWMIVAFVCLFLALLLAIILITVLIRRRKDKKRVESGIASTGTEVIVNAPIITTVEAGREEGELAEVKEGMGIESETPDYEVVVKDDGDSGGKPVEIKEGAEIESKTPDHERIVKDDGAYGGGERREIEEVKVVGDNNKSNNIDNKENRRFNVPEVDDKVEPLQDKKKNKTEKKHKHKQEKKNKDRTSETQNVETEKDYITKKERKGRKKEEKAGLKHGNEKKGALLLLNDTISSVTVKDFGSSGDVGSEVPEYDPAENGGNIKIGIEDEAEMFNNHYINKKRSRIKKKKIKKK